MKKNKGFTLIEVLAVLVILSLLITFSVVSVNKIKKKQEVANRINVIRSILTAARAYEADYPDTHNDVAITDFNVKVSTLLSKGYVDFDQDKYNEFTTATVMWNSYNNKREFYVDLKLLKKDSNTTSVSDCGLETDQTTNESGKKLCLKGSYNSSSGKSNGWDINGKAINSNSFNTVANING